MSELSWSTPVATAGALSGRHEARSTRWQSSTYDTTGLIIGMHSSGVGALQVGNSPGSLWRRWTTADAWSSRRTGPARCARRHDHQAYALLDAVDT